MATVDYNQFLQHAEDLAAKSSNTDQIFKMAEQGGKKFLLTRRIFYSDKCETVSYPGVNS